MSLTGCISLISLTIYSNCFTTLNSILCNNAIYCLAAYGMGTFPRWLGFIMLSVFAVYMFLTVRNGLRNPDTAASEEAEGEEKERKLWQELVLLVVGAAVIAVGADLLVEHGQIIAIELGVPATVVALLFVALGTSLPELVTTITSLRKGRASLGVGNVIGANIFNLVLVSGVAVSLAPFDVPVENTLLNTGLNLSLVFDIPVMLAVMSLMIFPALMHKKLSRWQGVALLGIYAAFVVLQFVL